MGCVHHLSDGVTSLLPDLLVLCFKLALDGIFGLFWLLGFRMEVLVEAKLFEDGLRSRPLAGKASNLDVQHLLNLAQVFSVAPALDDQPEQIVLALPSSVLEILLVGADDGVPRARVVPFDLLEELDDL